LVPITYEGRYVFVSKIPSRAMQWYVFVSKISLELRSEYERADVQLAREARGVGPNNLTREDS